MKTNIFLISFLIVGLTAKSQQTITKTFVHNSVTRSYIIYIPAIYNGIKPVPLVFNFHGYTMSASQQMTLCDFRPVADTAGFILVHPQGTLFNGNTHWNVGGWTNGSTADDIGFTNAMIDTIASHYNINLSKVYSTGFSNGGFFSFELACQLGNRIAAIGSVSGSMTPETYNNCNPKRPVPIIQIHGTTDNTILYNGMSYSKPIATTLAYWVNYNQTNINPIITSLPNLNTTDGSTVELYAYLNGNRCSSVKHYKVLGGGHEWPGSWGNMDINSSAEIWRFLRQYDLNGCTPVGINEPPIFSNISVSPNPSKDFIKLIYTVANVGVYDVIIYNSLGQRVISKHVSQNQIGTTTEIINLTELKSGMYFLQLTGMGSTIAVKIFKSE